jgi:magnesium-transporting ATPase (P-type)
MSSTRLGIWLGLGGLSMAVATLGAMNYVENLGASLEAVRSVGFITFSLTHLFAAVSYRFPQRSFFSLKTFNNRNINLALLFSLAAIYLPTKLNFLQRGMGLVAIGFQGWLVCQGLAPITQWVSEIFK